MDSECVAAPGRSPVKSRVNRRARIRRLSVGISAAAAAAIVALAMPAGAAAHGPVDPAASSYLATVTHVPAGIEARVVDGDLRLWLRVPAARTVIVLDYRGAPYLRFSPRGVQVNESSAMYYLNQVPPQTPPTDLGPTTPPQWAGVSSGHSYGWHDGRLHALATIAIAPGASYVGRWTVPLRVGGAPAAITGSLWFGASPSIVWFWPILVALACVAAAMRLRRPELDERLARALAAAALVAFAVAAVGQELHGRPFVSLGQEILLAVLLAFAAWGLRRVVLRRHSWFTFFLIAAAAIWEGGSLITTLLDGYVLLAVPPFLARVAVVTCLAAGLGLLPLVFGMAERPGRGRGGRRLSAAEADAEAQAEERDRLAIEAEEAWEPSA
ncbi:MAG: hypothetical protein ABSH51_06630 [Solirubrobacteraceae bacterium]|jgi:hypothetical protein